MLPRAIAGVVTLSLILSWHASAQSVPAIVISQVYGGGGNVGATLRNDFIELLNRGGVPVDVTGWTVQYASASGSTWDRTVLSGIIQPGQYYLVQQAQGNAGTVSLPAPDASGGLALSATAGKVALVRNSTNLTGASPSSTSIVDLLGYGSANFSLGKPAGALENTTAALRKGGGCTDTRNNSADFEVARPSPRNRQSTRNPCVPIDQPPPDTVAPSVSITRPLNGETVRGVVTLTAKASDNVGVAGVEFLIDGRSAGNAATGNEYSLSWDSAVAPDGAHTITAIARDAANNRATSAAISIRIENRVVQDTRAPEISLKNPASGTVVSGMVIISADASDESGVASVEFYVDGKRIGDEDRTPPYAITWDSRTIGNGSYAFTATAHDAAGNRATSLPNYVDVKNGEPADSTPTISAIVNGASFMPGPISPGEMVAIFGAYLGPASEVRSGSADEPAREELAGTRVLFDGAPGAVLATSSTAIFVVVPNLAGGHTSEIQVEFGGRRSAAVSLDAATSAPGLVAADLSGRGQAKAFNEDGTVNSPDTPAVRGSTVLLYATGVGDPDAASLKAQLRGQEAALLGIQPRTPDGITCIIVRVPEDLQDAGSVPVELLVGDRRSQPGLHISIAGSSHDFTENLIESKLRDLSSAAATALLPEVPHDWITLPADWLGLVSWNIQVGGTSTSSETRPSMVRDALHALFGGSYALLAAQEIPNQESSEFLRSLLPGGQANWSGSFFDTSDSMDNGFYFRREVKLGEAFPLFTKSERDSSGRQVADDARSEHPPQVARFEAGDFDFTLVTLHLTFAEGDTAASARELAHLLDYLDWYFKQPGHDPDVIVCGDFNIPSHLSGETGRDGITLDSVLKADPRFQTGERRFVVTVHEPTSRSPAARGGGPSRNYDHCVLSADTTEEFVQARRVDPGILTNHPDDPEQRLTSDHFPIVGFFMTKGPHVVRDNRPTIRPPFQ